MLSTVDENFLARKVSAAEWSRVLLRDPCAYCGAPCKEPDHIVPKVMNSQGTGAAPCTFGPENLTAACRRCNRSKGAHTLLGFLSGQQIGRNPKFKVGTYGLDRFAA